MGKLRKTGVQICPRSYNKQHNTGDYGKKFITTKKHYWRTVRYALVNCSRDKRNTKNKEGTYITMEHVYQEGNKLADALANIKFEH